MSLSIPPPASAVDVPRVIEDLKTKKAWFEANQARVTAENIAKAEENIQRLTNSKDVKTADAPSGGETPAEQVSSKDEDEASPKPTPSEALKKAEDLNNESVEES
ncbi:hypothetical protein C0993_006243 [Termitomyces sp. T159_Od127]|nr:hypothetical protein C0993_006243 [Termitomyces sp. T159_Od127]